LIRVIDGKGYPDGLYGQEISLGARIIAVVDSFDAMTTMRTYRLAFSVCEAIEEAERCKGSQFDPDIVDVLKALAIEKKLAIKQSREFAYRLVIA
jgi:HD-GYP domain-containing protein (c-di-GMP phosphodiesterase class II)